MYDWFDSEEGQKIWGRTACDCWLHNMEEDMLLSVWFETAEGKVAWWKPGEYLPARTQAITALKRILERRGIAYESPLLPLELSANPFEPRKGEGLALLGVTANNRA